MKAEVRGLLALTDADIRDMERALTEGSAEARVFAAGRLGRLHRRRSEIQAVAEDLDACDGGPISTAIEFARENWLLVRLGVEDWIASA
jgi:hypothetical protein